MASPRFWIDRFTLDVLLEQHPLKDVYQSSKLIVVCQACLRLEIHILGSYAFSREEYMLQKLVQVSKGYTVEPPFTVALIILYRREPSRLSWCSNAYSLLP